MTIESDYREAIETWMTDARSYLLSEVANGVPIRKLVDETVEEFLIHYPDEPKKPLREAVKATLVSWVEQEIEELEKELDLPIPPPRCLRSIHRAIVTDAEGNYEDEVLFGTFDWEQPGMLYALRGTPGSWNKSLVSTQEVGGSPRQAAALLTEEDDESVFLAEVEDLDQGLLESLRKFEDALEAM